MIDYLAKNKQTSSQLPTVFLLLNWQRDGSGVSTQHPHPAALACQGGLFSISYQPSRINYCFATIIDMNKYIIFFSFCHLSSIIPKSTMNCFQMIFCISMIRRVRNGRHWILTRTGAPEYMITPCPCH